MSDLADTPPEATSPLVASRPRATIPISEPPGPAPAPRRPAPEPPGPAPAPEPPSAAPTPPIASTTGISDAPPRRAARPRTEVRVAHGDLRFARDHVLVGHYPGTSLRGGEAALDEILDGRLSRAARLGIYPGALQTCQVFTDPADWASPPGAIVAGLGPVGELSAATLARATAQAALTAAMARLSVAGGEARHETEAVLPMRMSTVLVGAGGPGALPVRDSVQAILGGIHCANDRLRDADVPVHIARIQFLELWQDRALQALDAVHRSLAGSALEYSFVAERTLREMPGRQRRLVFADPPGWWQQVRVRSESDGALSFQASARRAGAPVRTVPTQRALVDRLVEALVDSPTPDPASSRALFELLFPNDLKAQAPDTDNLVLVVDPDAAHYPWELLDDHTADAGRVPLGVRRGLLRQLEGSTMRSHVLSATNARALVVGDAECGQTPLAAAQAEARSVGAALAGKGFHTQCLVAAPGQTVVQALFDGAYQVVHLAGHGVYRLPVGRTGPAGPTAGDGGASVTGMVLGNGMYLTAAEIGQMRQVPELVFVNCCHLGTVAPDRAAGAAPTSFHRMAASVATELISVGVRAVVACGWAVDDEAAGAFADALYAALLEGTPFGEAVKQARRSTWEGFPDVNTWGAYQCYGDPDYVLMLDGVASTRPRGHDLPCLQAAEVEIDNLSHSIDVTRDTRVGLRRLEEIQGVLADAGLDGPGLHVRLARAYHRMGSYDQAFAHFQTVLDAGGSTLTVADVELWIDQGVRTLVGGLDADALADQAVATVDESIAALRRFLADPTALVSGSRADPGSLPRPDDLGAGVGIDRLWRVASAYKRLAMLTCPARGRSARGAARGDWTRCREALADMADWYAAASRAAPERDPRQYRALANALAGHAALRWRPGPGRAAMPLAQGRALIGAARERACREADRRPTFWGIAGCADLASLQVLWGTRASASAAEPVLEIYRKAARMGSDEQVRQVRDQVAFLRLMAGTSARGRAGFLDALGEGLARLSAPRPGAGSPPAAPAR